MGGKYAPKPLGNVINFYSGNSATTITGGEWSSLSITNDAVFTDLKFTVNSIQVTVKPGETFDDAFAEFTSMTIDTNTAYRLMLRQ